MPHTLISMANYRQWRQLEGQPLNWLYDLVISYWSHSQGGGSCAKGLQLGFHNMSFMTNPKHLKFHLIGYLLTYWSPRNIVYRIVSQPRHPLRLFCVAMDALDANTTQCAMIDVGHKLHSNNNLLPYVVTILMCHFGSLVRWLDAKIRGKDVKTWLTEPGSGVTRAFLLTFLYCK